MKLPLVLPALIVTCVIGLLVRSHAQSPLTSGSRASDLDALKSHSFGSATSAPGGNLVPNGNFSDKTPLKFFRYDFPYQDFYVDNVKYVKQVNQGGKNCAELSLPAGIAGNQGGKIETALIPAEPGATYRAEVSCMTCDFSAKIHAEAYAEDPRPDAQRTAEESKGVKTTILRIPPMDGHKALVMIYRSQFIDPPGNSKKWDVVKREFTIPMDYRVAGEDVKPAFITIKATVYGATMNAGKSYFTDFKLVKIKEPGAAPAPKTSGPASNKDAVVR